MSLHYYINAFLVIELWMNLREPSANWLILNLIIVIGHTPGVPVSGKVGEFESGVGKIVEMGKVGESGLMIRQNC